jgi:CheY-like chemotaxis protein
VRTRLILVIDDDRALCDLVSSALTGAGYTVLAAFDGPSGMETARKAQPTVIILSTMMPGGDGIRTCERFKGDPVLRDTPMVAITGSQELEDTEQAFRAGAEFFLARPFGIESLIQVVGMAVDRAERPSPSQRLYPRFQARVPVWCLLGTDANRSQEVVGATGNLSLGGLLLMLPQKLEPGAVFRLRLQLPEGFVPAEGAVMWERSQPMGDGSFLHGVSLLRFAEDAGPVQYRRFLSEVAAASPP